MCSLKKHLPAEAAQACQSQLNGTQGFFSSCRVSTRGHRETNAASAAGLFIWRARARGVKDPAAANLAHAERCIRKPRSPGEEARDRFVSPDYAHLRILLRCTSAGRDPCSAKRPVPPSSCCHQCSPAAKFHDSRKFQPRSYRQAADCP